MAAQTLKVQRSRYSIGICAALIALQLPPELLAQANANPVTKAADAFGFQNGNESIGIYNESAVRGFSLESAGNYRVNGTYFVKSSGVSKFFVENGTVRVARNALSVTFPGPSGVVDYTLRDPARGEPSLLTTGVDEFSSTYAELFYRHRDSLNRFSAAIGATAFLHSGDKQNGRGSAGLVAGTFRLRLGSEGRAQVFLGEYEYTRSGSTFFTVSGNRLPTTVRRGDYLGQQWGQEHGARRIAGALFDTPLTSSWSIGATTVFSQEAPDRSVTQLFLDVDSVGRAQSLVVLSPRRRFSAYSGEARIGWVSHRSSVHQRAAVVIRGRATRNAFGGDQRVELGSVALGSPIQQDTEPNLAPTRATLRADIDQWAAGISYFASWRSRTAVTAGAMLNAYSSSFRALESASRSSRKSSPLLFNASVAHEVRPGSEVYAAYARGIEDAGVAPGSARNSGAVLNAVVTAQTEVGIRQHVHGALNLSAGAFTISKPYAGLDQATNTFTVIGDVTHRGLEASISGPLRRDLSIVLGGVLLDPQLRLRQGAAIRTTRPVGVPRARWIANANLDVSRVSGLSLDGGIEYTGRVSARTSLDAVPLWIPGHAIINVGARQHLTLSKHAVTVRAQVLNIGNVYDWIVTPAEALEYGAQRRFRMIITAER